MKEWKKPKLQILDLNEVAKKIFANARSTGGGGCISCNLCKPLPDN